MFLNTKIFDTNFTNWRELKASDEATDNSPRFQPWENAKKISKP